MKRKILNPYNKIPQHECFACSDHNSIGLKLKFYEEDEYVKANWKPLYVDQESVCIQAKIIDFKRSIAKLKIEIIDSNGIVCS